MSKEMDGNRLENSAQVENPEQKSQPEVAREPQPAVPSSSQSEPTPETSSGQSSTASPPAVEGTIEVEQLKFLDFVGPYEPERGLPPLPERYPGERRYIYIMHALHASAEADRIFEEFLQLRRRVSSAVASGSSAP